MSRDVKGCQGMSRDTCHRPAVTGDHLCIQLRPDVNECDFSMGAEDTAISRHHIVTYRHKDTSRCRYQASQAVKLSSSCPCKSFDMLQFYLVAFGSLSRASFCDRFGVVAPWGHSQCHRIHSDLRATPFQESK